MTQFPGRRTTQWLILKFLDSFIFIRPLPALLLVFSWIHFSFSRSFGGILDLFLVILLYIDIRRE